MRHRERNRIFLLAGLAILALPGAFSAQQIGGLVSPGPLSRAHARLEGLDNCQKCHEPGKQVTPAKCLACHAPISERIAARKGVHRDAGGTCISCHIEHAGIDAEITRFDRKRFDHSREAGFALDGKHGAVPCASCHRTRSFLAASPSCVSCHADAHRGTLGPDCAKCHNPAVPFRESRRAFDHDRTAYPLTGAHRLLPCAKCHTAAGVYKVLKFAACSDCHRDPHRKALGACETCHTTGSFRTEKIDHAKTGFPLLGRHAATPCAKCHARSAVRFPIAAARCADCHRDVHRGVFREDCASCHTEKGFSPATFDHDRRTKFALDGKHRGLACAACHRPGPTPENGGKPRAVEFRGAKPECASCHADVHRGELGLACQKCHTTQSFRISAYTHPRNPDFFAGAHAPVPCEKCHGAPKPGAERRFTGVPFACATCHRDVHLGQLGAACEKCHSISSPKFAAPQFSHAAARFPLTGKHADLPCAKCHRSETGTFPAGSGTAVRWRGVPLECAGCHRDPHLGSLGANCASCHSTGSFAVPGYVHRNKGLATFFTGAHASAACEKCHRKPEGQPAIRYAGTPAACGSCHGDPHRGVLGERCESCHSTREWKNASRAFHKLGVFPLDGKHLLVPCESCHLKGVVKGTPNRCFDCHWIRRQDDPYRTRLGNQCEVCHRTISWAALTWNHLSQTGFALTGAHATLACESCHKNQVFTAAKADCYSCHKQDYDRTTNPNHAAAGFSILCQTCHKPSDASWQQAVFPHASVYPLVGVHATQPCSACHINNVFKGTPTDCYACHQTVYHQAVNPNHIAAGFPTTCQTCHKASDSTWQQGTFNHAAIYPLLGVHATQPCSACHVNNVFKGTPTDCYACHQAVYHQASNPNHIAAGFGTTCQSCHRPSDPSWQQGTFNHSAVYPLLGVHAAQPCLTCHVNNVFKGTPTDCYACHQIQYQQSANPNHAAAGFPTTCQTCHKASDATWQQATFDHSSIFPLVGVHATQPCAACHLNNVFPGTPTDCYSCHKTQYQQSANPNHVAAGFPTTCQTCHKATDASWQQGVFNHSTFFALVGVHATQPCSACHVNNVFKGTPTDCYSCHKTQYQQAANPNHVAAGFPTSCQNCHKATDASWQQGVFNHTTFYPLLGVHATQPCSACHVNNVFPGTPTDCYSCHKTKYQQTTNPSHVAAGFPTTCQNCHKASDASWLQGIFNHTTFYPLLGVHATQPCSACHVNNVFAGTPTDCYSCHKTQYQQTTNPNHIAAGFPTTCQSCHKASDASWLQGVFNHTWFPITSGAHAGHPCSACHTNPLNFAVFTCLTCHDRATTDSHHTGVPGYQYVSQACYSCHPTGRSD